MNILDIGHACDFLNYCSYYRFCGYALPYEILTENGERTHQYYDGTSFDDVENLYHFDAALRRLIFHYTSIIEINFRTKFTNETAMYYNDAHWFLNSERFVYQKQFAEFTERCNKEILHSREVFIRNYKKKYSFPTLPPIWMIAELMSFATWSKLFQNLKDSRLKKKIAMEQGIPLGYLASWLESLTVLRNACAHHARIWNRNFTCSPLLSPKIRKKININSRRKIAVFLLIICDFLKQLNRQEEFRKDITDLFEQYPSISKETMGITCNLSVFLS